MRSSDSGRNIRLTSYDDIFSTEESRASAGQEKIVEIPLINLHPNGCRKWLRVSVSMGFLFLRLRVRWMTEPMN